MNAERLFQPGEAPDRAYCNLRDRGHNAELRAFCESLWQRYSPYADRHFLAEIRTQFNQRFWEMYLGVAILDHGYKLHRLGDHGPEFGIDINGRRFWFEAITPTGGEGPDAVPPLEYGGREARRVPQEQIILRITSALATKRAKWVRDMANGLVNRSDGFIVAMNDRSIRDAIFGGSMPYVVKALYGFGDIQVAIDVKTMQIIESRHQHRPALAKAGGVQVSTQPFAAEECPEVSAVLHSSVDAANFPARFGGDFLILHNSRPTVQLPMGVLPFAREYWIDDEHLCMKEWKAPA